jgi:hypothetical protein
MRTRKGNEMSYGAICIAAVAALGIAGGGARAERWCNPDYSTGSYSPSYSTGGYFHPCYSIKYSDLSSSHYSYANGKGAFDKKPRGRQNHAAASP